MLTAISRYGARVAAQYPGAHRELQGPRRIHPGPDIAALRSRIRRAAGTGHAVAASYGRMAFYYVLKALDLPPGSEIVLPALTFWVVPEIARVAGLKVGLCRRRPEHLHDGSAGTRAGDHAGDPRRRADAPLRPVVRHGRIMAVAAATT